ncbi:hypothetical protein HU811_17815 [Pseudomonas sp. SWRI196]|uniref:CRISPR-associated protein Cas2 n=1 Tax=Pseudomonas tehranensis TaxID=2745502 RepID=A0ABR6UV87_9PSED|nr:hypothetical protein [Pseudomonas tehranensis]MBC3348497.1 hypothetical protein [Pseudomonas tehranensis]
MANNLFVSYDLKTPGQNYEKLIEGIKTLGPWAKLQQSFWYVNSNLDAAAAGNYLKQFTDANDYLVVVDATNNNVYWFNCIEPVSDLLKKQWWS